MSAPALRHVPLAELERIRRLDAAPEDRAAAFAERAVAEVTARLDARLGALGESPIRLAAGEPRRVAAPARPQRLVPAYAEALVRQANAVPELVVLDGDLSLDCGLMPFRARFGERFFECGIAEQDMVSQAGAMALAGLLPVVHSFACFLSTRPNEQIYNNATEGSKVIYVGSLAGLVPGGPGHSHQSVRDVSALGAVPGMSLLEPFCEREVELALEWAVRDAAGPVYLRLVSVPWELGFEPPADLRLRPGRGTLLREGDEALLVATGPVMVAQAWRAADVLADQGIAVSVLALPWLRDVDGAWLAELPGADTIFTLDNHYRDGGQGAGVLAALASARPGSEPRVERLAVESVPVCGTNDEVLEHHRLDGRSVAERVRETVGARV